MNNPHMQQAALAGNGGLLPGAGMVGAGAPGASHNPFAAALLQQQQQQQAALLQQHPQQQAGHPMGLGLPPTFLGPGAAPGYGPPAAALRSGRGGTVGSSGLAPSVPVRSSQDGDSGNAYSDDMGTGADSRTGGRKTAKQQEANKVAQQRYR